MERQRIGMLSNRNSYTNLSVEELKQHSVNAQRQSPLLRLPSEIISIVLSFCLPMEIGKLSLTSKIFQDLSDEVARDMLLALFEKNDKITHRDKLRMRKCLSRDNLQEIYRSDGDDTSTSPIWTLLASIYAQSKPDEVTSFNPFGKVVDINTGALTRSESHPNLRYLNHISTERIVLLGGGGSTAPGGMDYRNVNIFTPEEKNREETWKVCNNMNISHGYFFIEAVAMKGEVYVISGDDSDSAGTVEKFNYLNNEWTACPSIPCKNMFVSAAVVNDSIVVSGGLSQINGEFSSNVYRMNQNSKGELQWINAGVLPGARYGHASVYYDGKVWILGGQLEGQQRHSNECLLYDPLTYEFEIGPPSKVDRVWSRVFVLNKQLFVVGGDNVSSKSLPSIETYDKNDKCWKIVTYFPTPRKLYASVASGTKIYVFGGRDENYCNIDTFDIFDVTTKIWSCAINGNMKCQTIGDREHFHGGHAVCISYA